MTTSSRNWFASARRLALTGAAALLLAACTGGSDNTGPQGPDGPEGPPGGGVPPGAVASATSLQVRINRAVVGQDGRPVVDVFIADQTGRPVTGLPAGNIRFVMARLEPAANGKSSTWHAMTRRIEAFPGTPAPTPADRVTGTARPTRATRKPDRRAPGSTIATAPIATRSRTTPGTTPGFPTTPACRTASASRSARHRMSRRRTSPPTTRPTRSCRPPTRSSSSPAARSSTTTPATPVTTTWCSTAARAST